MKETLFSQDKKKKTITTNEKATTEQQSSTLLQQTTRHHTMKSGLNNNSGGNGGGNDGTGYNEIIHLLDSDTEDDGTTKATTTKFRILGDGCLFIMDSDSDEDNDTVAVTGSSTTAPWGYKARPCDGIIQSPNLHEEDVDRHYQ